MNVVLCSKAQCAHTCASQKRCQREHWDLVHKKICSELSLGSMPGEAKLLFEKPSFEIASLTDRTCMTTSPEHDINSEVLFYRRETNSGANKVFTCIVSFCSLQTWHAHWIGGGANSLTIDAYHPCTARVSARVKPRTTGDACTFLRALLTGKILLLATEEGYKLEEADGCAVIFSETMSPTAGT